MQFRQRTRNAKLAKDWHLKLVFHQEKAFGREGFFARVRPAAAAAQLLSVKDGSEAVRKDVSPKAVEEGGG